MYIEDYVTEETWAMHKKQLLQIRWILPCGKEGNQNLVGKISFCLNVEFFPQQKLFTTNGYVECDCLTEN